MRRRDFLKLSTGVAIACRINALWAFQAGGQMPRLDYPTDFNAYLRRGSDGRLTCYVGKIEMGQGNMTALTQLVAEELGVPVDSLQIVMGDTDLCPWDLGTFGSMSVAVFGPVLRRAAARAREAAANPGAAGVAAPPMALKDPSTFKIVGQSVPRLDAIGKVTGAAIFAGDVRLPGMLYAKVFRPPVHDATPIRVVTSAVDAVKGAIVVRDGELLAVLHEHPDEAARAAASIVAEFDFAAAPLDDVNIFDHLVAEAPAAVQAATSGDVAQGERLASAILEQTYLNSYVAHAAMETHTALAQWNDGRCTIWASTQAPFLVRNQVAGALGVAPDRVRIITPFVGGGFGGKTMAPQAVEAARLARASGHPVQVAWDRAEEFFSDTFRPAALVKLRTGVDAAGHVVLWTGDVYAAGDGGAAPFYDVPHQSVRVYGGWQNPAPGQHPFAVGAWRAPAFNSNTFAREMQMDAMASRAGVDPIEFRLNNLKDERMRRVLQTVADRAGWQPVKGSSGRGVGVACGVYANTYVATVAEVTVDRSTGHVQVTRVVCAQDMGLVVNPDGARMQIEGCVTMGLGYALSEEIRFSNGDIAARNFDTYQIPRFSWVPRIDAVLVDSSMPPSAGGEPAIMCMGAVIGNAIHDATGARVLQLPMTPARVLATLR
jgi:nicotinate dehydrogenase subunit B